MATIRNRSRKHGGLCPRTGNGDPVMGTPPPASKSTQTNSPSQPGISNGIAILWKITKQTFLTFFLAGGWSMMQSVTLWCQSLGGNTPGWDKYRQTTQAGEPSRAPVANPGQQCPKFRAG